MNHTETLLLDLFLVFVGGKLFAEIFERLRQPAIVGQILAGLLLGPSLLGWLQPNDVLAALAEIGAILLLFTVGLETRPRDLLAVGGTATLVGTLGVVVPFALGYAYMRATSHAGTESIFLAAAMVATSVGVTAAVLKDAGALGTHMARVILAAAVLDDILGMIVLAVVTSLSEGRVHYLQLAIVAGEAILFSLFAILLGARIVRRLEPHVARLRTSNSAFVLAVVLCLGLSLASVYVGMAAIIGAFLAGLALADQSERWRLAENVHPLYEFLAPFFFVYLGVQVNARTLTEPGVIAMAAVVTLLAIVSKLIGCGAGALRLGWRQAARIGVGMVPRGEVGLIVAAAGASLHVISDRVFTVVLLMSALTTLLAPPALRALLPGKTTARDSG
jgi:Kef-type K+ transport system membrane component KefB